MAYTRVRLYTLIGTNQKFGGPEQDFFLGGGCGACAPWPQPKTATGWRRMREEKESLTVT